MAYLGKTPSQAVRSRYYFTASGGETSLAPAQVTGLSFTDANYVDVSLNGVALVSGTDYTATPSTNTISSLSALTASDVVEIVVYDVFSVFGGSVNGDFNISGGDLTLGDNDKAIFGAGSDLQIYHDSATNHSIITESGTGNLLLQADNLVLQKANGGNNYLKATANAQVDLYYNNAIKLATTSTGVDITGTVTANGGANNNIVRIVSTDANANIEFADNTTTSGLSIGANGDNMKFGINGTEAMRIHSSGRVSIGGTTVTDVNMLNIQGSGASSNIGVVLNDTNTSKVYSIQNGGSSLKFHDYSASATRMVIDSSGNVGISNTTPSSFFAGATNLVVGSGSGNQGMTIFSGTSSIGNIKFADGTGSDAAKSAGGIRYDHNSNFMRFDTNDGTEAMRITSGGAVGIGTSSPSVRLDTRLGTTTGKVAEFHNSAGYGIGFTVESDGGVNTINSETNQALAFATNGASNERIRIDTSGIAKFSSANNVGRIMTNGTVTIADDSSITLTNATAGAVIAMIYDRSSGTGASVFFSYEGSPEIIKQSGSNFTIGDTDVKYCIIKSANNHTATFKNRIGSSRTFNIFLIGGDVRP